MDDNLIFKHRYTNDGKMRNVLSKFFGFSKIANIVYANICYILGAVSVDYSSTARRKYTYLSPRSHAPRGSRICEAPAS
ncbi:hypothetical protein NIES3974_48260 [Calothrix sp. NIES-3974]|nr:hypothetical protein NIES3974_48260 [Calothrix sp. NIES-3974]